MFDFNFILFGQRIRVNGEVWISLQYFRDGFHLAVKPIDTMPAQAFLVREDRERENET